MKAETSQDLQSPCWRPSEPMVQIQSESKCLRTRKVDGISSSLKASRLVTREEWIFQFGFEGRKILMFQLPGQAGGIPSSLWEGQPFSSNQAIN